MLVTCKYLSACLINNINYDQSIEESHYRAKTQVVTDCNKIYICSDITVARPTAKWCTAFCREPDFEQRCHLLVQAFTKPT